MKYYILIFLYLSLSFSSDAQKKYTISGYIQDAETGEKLIGSSIYIKNLKAGTVTNQYGFYSITLPEDSVELIVAYLGYQTIKKRFFLDQDIQFNIDLTPSSLELEEVKVEAESAGQIIRETQMSKIVVPVAQIKSLPALFGEVDVMKAMQLLPGVQSGMEGTSGLYVRGGGPDQNLILLDGTPVYNVSHLFGFFSIFNADAINNIELIKGGFPARYGGRLSSVMEINLKEGNMKKIHGEGSIGIISSKLTLEGPIVKDKTSFIVSARRTYLDILIQPLIRALTSEDENTSTGYYFYDLNAKLNHKFSDKDRLYLSIYSGKDKFYNRSKSYSYLYDGVTYQDQSKSSLSWGNITSALRWNHLLNNKIFSNVTLTYSQYNFMVKNFLEETATADTGTTINSFSLKYLSGINDWSAKIDFDYLPDPNHYIKFGASNIYHTFKPGATTYKITNIGVSDIDSTLGSKDVYANEFAIYLEDDIKFTKRLKTNIGLHFSGFMVQGTFYNSLQPRLALRYLLTDSWSAKVSFATMQQYIHLLTNNNIGLPTDLWVPATEKIPPQNSNQVATGLAKNISDKYLLSVEGYYKTMNNLIEYKDGATFLNSETDWQDKVETGKGWSYGAELFIQKKRGKTTGWLGYTLSWTNRQFENINFGKKYPYKYDRRHDISIVLIHKLNDKWDFSATWVFGTGNAITLPIVRYNGYNDNGIYDYWDCMGGVYCFTNEIEYYEQKNDYRIANYHRLDLGFKHHKERKWGESIWNFGVYNAYIRKNPFYYYFGRDKRGNRVLKRVSIFPFIPSVSYSFKF